jgi:hypothetical protein
MAESLPLPEAADQISPGFTVFDALITHRAAPPNRVRCHLVVLETQSKC